VEVLSGFAFSIDQYAWNTGQLPAGIYLAVIETDGETFVRKLVAGN
jgi:hypothetical protein